MIRAVIFDCFGVIYEDAFKQFVDRHTRGDAKLATPYFDVDNALNRGFLDDNTYYRQLAELSGEAAIAIRRQLNDTSSLNRAVVAIIAGLRPQYRIAMLSNADRPLLDRFLGAHDIAHLFDVVVASSETGFIKPQ
jgi:FMN phosphatase YigB (HAD superfamily)